MHASTILVTTVLALSLPVWFLMQISRTATGHGQSTLPWLSLQIGWLYLPAVAFGFTRVNQRRPSRGQLVELLWPPASIVVAVFLLSLLGASLGIRMD